MTCKYIYIYIERERERVCISYQNDRVSPLLEDINIDRILE
jgi:hypothetical protein